MEILRGWGSLQTKFCNKKSETAVEPPEELVGGGGGGGKRKKINGGYGYFQELHTTPSVFTLCMETRVSLVLAVMINLLTIPTHCIERPR